MFFITRTISNKSLKIKVFYGKSLNTFVNYCILDKTNATWAKHIPLGWIILKRDKTNSEGRNRVLEKDRAVTRISSLALFPPATTLLRYRPIDNELTRVASQYYGNVFSRCRQREKQSHTVWWKL